MTVQLSPSFLDASSVERVVDGLKEIKMKNSIILLKNDGGSNLGFDHWSEDRTQWRVGA